jgi:uncharacterized protein YhbP (UPF0306 family)
MSYTQSGKSEPESGFPDPTTGTLAELLALSTMTLATCNPGGQPHAAPVYFAALRELHPQGAQPLRLIFFSEAHSQHGQDFAGRDTAGQVNAAGAIYPECTGWQEIRGLQLRGRVRRVQPGEEWDLAWQAYRQKFPFAEDLLEIVQRNALYVLTPSWLRLVDNRAGFGYKKEWQADGE